MPPAYRTAVHEAGHAVVAHAVHGAVALGIIWPDDADDPAAGMYAYVDPLAHERADRVDAFAVAVVATAGDAAVHRLLPAEAATAPTGTDRARLAEAYAFGGYPAVRAVFRRFVHAAWVTAHAHLAARHDELVNLAGALAAGGDLPEHYLHPVERDLRRLRDLMTRAKSLDVDAAPVIDQVSGFMRPDPLDRFRGTPAWEVKR